MLKILKPGFKSVNRELPDVQIDLIKVEEPEIILATSLGS